MKNNKILVTEISGKRPGDKRKRPTEGFNIAFDHIIISNDSEGYITDWEVVNVPDEYRKWYIENHKNSDRAYYAPMNRSYAIKYAKEHGYEYLVQLDDNITRLEIACLTGKAGNVQERVRILNEEGMINDFIELFEVVLDNTNAAMVGCDLSGLSTPSQYLLKERYCYSLFCLNLSRCPDIFQGDFEDDIEFRLKCKQMGVPVVQICPLRYSKTAQEKVKDLSGCRAEYLKAGINRGAHMKRLYGDVYNCKMRQKRQGIKSKYDSQAENFKHTLQPFKVGVIVKDMPKIRQKFNEIVAKYVVSKPDKAIYKERKVLKKKATRKK